jgi:ketosteroid isomerase-like protein
VPRADLAHETDVEIAAHTGRFSAALTDGDGARAAAVYGEDALLLPPAGGVISGRTAIARFWRSGIEIGLRGVELEPLGCGGAGAVLYEHGRYRMLLAPIDGRSNVERGPYIVVHVRADDGSWHWAVSTFGDRQQEREET